MERVKDAGELVVVAGDDAAGVDQSEQGVNGIGVPLHASAAFEFLADDLGWQRRAIGPGLAIASKPSATAMIHALRYEVAQFRTEEWSRQLVADLCDSLPLFRQYWSVVDQEAEVASAKRVLVPVRLATPLAGTLKFRLTAEPFTRDSRFRLVYYLPGDPETMRRCAAWEI